MAGTSLQLAKSNGDLFDAVQRYLKPVFTGQQQMRSVYCRPTAAGTSWHVGQHYLEVARMSNRNWHKWLAA
jgi:hypothetical protein